ncbi:MAG: hypothetical protein LBF94_01340 [Puniceicoccales bacterium]|nr:hypothetical protein [Puniceicoccales bacterium]
MQKCGKLDPFIGLHNFCAKIASRPECIPKVCEFSLRPGNLHDVSCAEEILAGYAGTVIGDSGYVSANNSLPNAAKT